jgi:hypothetical protein
MTVECTLQGGKWEGEVLGYCDVDHLKLRKDEPVNSIADDLKG